jgi:hypothetical protein
MEIRSLEKNKKKTLLKFNKNSRRYKQMRDFILFTSPARQCMPAKKIREECPRQKFYPSHLLPLHVACELLKKNRQENHCQVTFFYFTSLIFERLNFILNYAF